MSDGEAGGEHDLVAEQLARARPVHPRRDELLADLVLAEAREPPGGDVAESAGEGVERAATAGLVDLRASRRLCDVPVGPDLVERRRARRSAQAEDEDRDAGSEEEDACDCDDFQTHVYTSISTIFLIANQPAIEQNDPRAEREAAGVGFPERLEPDLVDGEEEEQEHDRDRRENVAGDPALRGQDADEAPELHPAADVLDHAVEHLGRVASRLALQARDDRDLLDVEVVHPPRHHHQRVVERDAELLVLEDAAELGLGRLRGAVDHDAHRADEAVPGAKRAREHLEVVRQLLGERSAQLVDPALDDCPQ